MAINEISNAHRPQLPPKSPPNSNLKGRFKSRIPSIIRIILLAGALWYLFVDVSAMPPTTVCDAIYSTGTDNGKPLSPYGIHHAFIIQTDSARVLESSGSEELKDQMGVEEAELRSEDPVQGPPYPRELSIFQDTLNDIINEPNSTEWTRSVVLTYDGTSEMSKLLLPMLAIRRALGSDIRPRLADMLWRVLFVSCQSVQQQADFMPRRPPSPKPETEAAAAAAGDGSKQTSKDEKADVIFLTIPSSNRGIKASDFEETDPLNRVLFYDRMSALGKSQAEMVASWRDPIPPTPDRVHINEPQHDRAEQRRQIDEGDAVGYIFTVAGAKKVMEAFTEARSTEQKMVQQSEGQLDGGGGGGRDSVANRLGWDPIQNRIDVMMTSFCAANDHVCSYLPLQFPVR